MSAVDERVFEEAEVLEAILLNDLVIQRTNNVPEVYIHTVHPATGDNLQRRFVCVTLEVKLTPGYPDTKPDVTLRNFRGLDDDVIKAIKEDVATKLDESLGVPVVYELVQTIQGYLDECNLPTGQCAICLYGFERADVYVRTQCYHAFHCYCLAKHLVMSKQNHEEEMAKLPNWQQAEAPPFYDTCPVCRSQISCDLAEMMDAPPPEASNYDLPFCITPDIKAVQKRMAALLARQMSRGGIIGCGDDGPQTLTITTPEDRENEATSSSRDAKVASVSNARPAAATPSNPAATPASPARENKVPFRGFNRRGKPGRRGRGGR